MSGSCAIGNVLCVFQNSEKLNKVFVILTCVVYVGALVVILAVILLTATSSHFVN